MPMTPAIAAAIVLLGAWLGPLPELARHSFAAHMTMHMAVVAVAAPLLAMAAGGTTMDPVRVVPRLFAPIPVSVVELLVVWTWHVPDLHHAARQHGWAFGLEQASFLVTGFALWIAAIGGTREQRRLRSGAGVIALLFTSMHMTLLGALFALGNRPLFQHTSDVASSLADQHLGGAIMLLIGGASYMAGGLWLTAGMLRAYVPLGAVSRKRP